MSKVLIDESILEGIIDLLCSGDGDCPSFIGLKNTSGSCKETPCYDCWKNAILEGYNEKH